MLRILGFISGSALVFAALIFLLQPDITEQVSTRSVPVRFKPLADPVPAPEPAQLPQDVAGTAEEATVSVPPPMPETMPVDIGETAPVAVSEEPFVPTAQPVEQEWHALWDPFHSEFSAKAFAARLERVTGLDYSVVKVGAGEYQVAVAARSDEELVANLARIEEATGLRLVSNNQP